MNLKGKEAQIRNMIEGQEHRIALARKRIEELKEQLFDLSNMKPVEVEKVTVIDNHKYCGKILYSSKKIANSARKLINRDLKNVGKPPMKRSYFCNQCEAWHLTTVPHWSPHPENENSELISL